MLGEVGIIYEDPKSDSVLQLTAKTLSLSVSWSSITAVAEPVDFLFESPFPPPPLPQPFFWASRYTFSILHLNLRWPISPRFQQAPFDISSFSSRSHSHFLSTMTSRQPWLRQFPSLAIIVLATLVLLALVLLGHERDWDIRDNGFVLCEHLSCSKL